MSNLCPSQVARIKEQVDVLENEKIAIDRRIQQLLSGVIPDESL